MSDQKVDEKKMVSRSVAIALGIICIVLVASLAGTLIVLNIANQQNTNLQSELTDLSAIINLTKSEVIFENKTIDISPAAFIWDAYQTGFSATYSGLVKVDVEPPNPSLWVEVTWDYGQNDGIGYASYPSLVYTDRRVLGGEFSAPYNTWYYPIIASPSADSLGEYFGIVTVYIGNNSTKTITANVTITYYY